MLAAPVVMPVDFALSAARRAAVYAALCPESRYWPAWQRSAPSFIDGFCALQRAADRIAIPDAALAYAGAEADPSSSAVARALLTARHYLRHALGNGSSNLWTSSSENHADFQAVTDCASLDNALQTAKALGCRNVVVPRSILGALRGARDGGSLGGAELAEILTQAFLPRHSSLERKRYANVRDAGRRKRGALAAAVNAALQIANSEASTGVYSTEDSEIYRRSAEAADAVWTRVPDAPPAHTRVQTLLGALAWRRSAHGIVMLTQEHADVEDTTARIIFQDAPAESAASFFCTFAAAVSADATALSAAAQAVRCMRVLQTEARAVSMYLAAADNPLSALWRWPPPEPSRRVVAPAMTFSASRLNSFAKCPRRWFYEYLCDAVEDRSSPQAVYGKVFHEALQALHTEIRAPAEYSHAVIAERLASQLDTAFGKFRHEFPSRLDFEVSRLRARGVAEHYVRWLRDLAAREPFSVAEVELLQRWTTRGHSFVGYVDRIDRPSVGGPVTIFDYKTGRIDEDPNEYLRKIREGEEAQLALYYSMRRALGEPVGRIALISIRDPRDRVRILALDVIDEQGHPIMPRERVVGELRASCTVADLEAALAKLVARCDLLTLEGVEHFSAGKDPPCNFCEYAPACRERRADGERIFAR